MWTKLRTLKVDRARDRVGLVTVDDPDDVRDSSDIDATRINGIDPDVPGRWWVGVLLHDTNRHTGVDDELTRWCHAVMCYATHTDNDDV